MTRPYLSIKDTLSAIRPSLFAAALLISREERKAKSEKPLHFWWCWDRRKAARPAESARAFVSFPSTGGVDVSLHTLGSACAEHRCRTHSDSLRPRKSETLQLL